MEGSKQQSKRGRNAFLVGERLYLRPLDRCDLAHIQRWANDPQTRAETGEVLPTTTVANEEWFERLNKDSSRVWFAVVLKEDDRVIGEAGLLRMHHFWRTTDLTMIIGEKDAQGKGYGTEAIGLLVDYAFGYLNFHRVAVGVVGFNKRAISFYESVGFKQEGVQRDGYFYNHSYHDFIMMSLLEDEFLGG